VRRPAIVLVGLGAPADAHGAWPVGACLATTFALTAIGRVVLAGAVAALALTMTRRAVSGRVWAALAVTATVLVASSAVVSHAVARVEWRAPLVALDALHQLAAALWVGGLAHLTLYAIADGRSGELVPPAVHAGPAAPATTIRRFSTPAFWPMAALGPAAGA